jgi:DNA polymerase-1
MAAEKALKNLLGVEPYEHTLKSGPRKGQTETRWQEVEMGDFWSVVVSHFNAAGLSEQDALQQARVARILRASDYDFKNKKPILWTPKTPV